MPRNTSTTGRKKTAASSNTKSEETMLRELFVEELKDIYWAEKHLTKALPKGQKISPKEVQLATKLIHQLTETFDPAAFKDTYISALKKLIKAKAAGKDIKIAEPKRATATVKDLMEVLKQSLDSAPKKKRA